MQIGSLNGSFLHQYQETAETIDLFSSCGGLSQQCESQQCRFKRQLLVFVAQYEQLEQRVQRELQFEQCEQEQQQSQQRTICPPCRLLRSTHL